jgi:hypothetical protein
MVVNKLKKLITYVLIYCLPTTLSKYPLSKNPQKYQIKFSVCSPSSRNIPLEVDPNHQYTIYSVLGFMGSLASNYQKSNYTLR